MKKIIFPVITVFTLSTAVFSIEASSQEGLPGEGTKDICFARWYTGGTENFVSCSNCMLVYNGSNPIDKGTCKP
ncbi:hypothetical protein [Sediminibacterium sp.]|uniref:hypothetical protein n=1 Tax=Sediminibacterium sp. TaxID=1917865 RepID=UPI0025FC074B|nr:hypothetical protein [Sediminibacterium sp.]